MTINGIAIPPHLLFCAKQGRANTDKPSLPISMPKELTDEFSKYDIDIKLFPIIPDSWFVSEKPEQGLTNIGFGRIVLAGKSNYVFRIREKKQKISEWKKEIAPISGQWGTDVPSRPVA